MNAYITTAASGPDIPDSNVSNVPQPDLRPTGYISGTDHRDIEPGYYISTEREANV